MDAVTSIQPAAVNAVAAGSCASAAPEPVTRKDNTHGTNPRFTAIPPPVCARVSPWMGQPTLLTGPEARPHAGAQAHVVLALGKLRNQARGQLTPREDRRIPQLRPYLRLRSQVTVREARRVAVLRGDRGVHQEIDEQVGITRVRRVRWNGRDIEPHDRTLARNRIADLLAVGGNPDALLRLHRIAVAGDDQTQLTGSQIVDQRARTDLANRAANRHERALGALQDMGVLAVGRLAEPGEYARN